MSYFAAHLGPAPLTAPHPVELWPTDEGGWRLCWPVPPPGVTAVRIAQGEAEPLAVVAQVATTPRHCAVTRAGGPRVAVAWQRGDEVGPMARLVLPAPAPVPPPEARCPLCQSAMMEKAGLWWCQGRCGGGWLREGGQWLALAALPFGRCACCAPPRALVRGDGGPCCPGSGRTHLLLPDGTPRLLDEARRAGLCHCCAPPYPLQQQGDQLCCPAKPHHRYALTDQGATLLAPTPKPLLAPDLLDAIDEALQQNSAQVGLYGLWVMDE